MTDLDTMLAPIKDLAAKWNCEGKRCYEIANETKTVNEGVIAQAVRYWECARELEALLPALEQRIIAMQEEGTELGMKLTEAQAEVTALKESMKCGHPKACRRELRHQLSDIAGDYEVADWLCTACEAQLDHERLAVAAALRDQLGRLRKIANDWEDPELSELCDEQEALISPADRAALDASLKAAEHKGWCDALRHVEGSIRNPRTGGHIPIMEALDAHDAEVKKSGYLDGWQTLASVIKAHIPNFDSAHVMDSIETFRADTRNRALEEAITPELMCDFLLGKFTQYDHDWVNVAKYFREALKKTLKREKRGGE